MSLAMQESIFTTGRVAQICKVAPRTVSKWFDSGKLRGYRIPGSQDRRIPRENLIRFLKEHGMPLGELEVALNVLLVGGDADLQNSLEPRLAQFDGKLLVANSEFEAGIHAEGKAPVCIVIDFSISARSAHALALHMKRHPALAATVVIGLVNPDDQNIVDRKLFADTFRKPFDPELLFHRITTLVERRK